MIHQDSSWKSLFKPGEATKYFTLSNPEPIQINSGDFNLSNAWWLAELSRLIYNDNFLNNKKITLGSFKHELLGFIENKKTSTRVGLFIINQDCPCLVIVFQGTDEIEDWNVNIHAYQMPFGNAGKVHNGFKKAYLSIQVELMDLVSNNALPIFVTGHSLGAALATLASSELADNQYFDSCYTFGSPRTGDPEFINSFSCENIYRVINKCDVVTTVPIDFATIKYNHVGSAYLINDKGVLLKKLSEQDVYSYQKNKIESLKKYAVTKIFNNDLKSIKDDLPPFLANHAPFNYVAALQNLINI